MPQATILTSRKSREFLLADFHFFEGDFSGFLRDAAEQGVADGARLLEDFLVHEMLESALFRHDRIPVMCWVGWMKGRLSKSKTVNALRSEHRNFAVAEKKTPRV